VEEADGTEVPGRPRRRGGDRTTATTNSAFRALTLAGCEERLAQQSAGRVAWDAPDGPVVLPVSHQLHLGRVSFRTSA